MICLNLYLNMKIIKEINIRITYIWTHFIHVSYMCFRISSFFGEKFEAKF